MLKFLQRIGKALMVPVAVLPAAAILMGIGYWIDPSGWGANNQLAGFLIKSGAGIIDNMSILFAVGVAYGMSDDKNGAAALSGLVGYEVLTTLLAPASVASIKGIDVAEVSLAFSKIENQFIGILIGVIAALLYNRFRLVELPKALAFFSGRRFVPIITSISAMLLSVVLLFVWPVLFESLESFGIFIQTKGAFGAGVYGFLNRLLIPFGLHHALNSVFWFDVAGINDLNNFWQGIGEKGITGRYMAGFFPIMMFGLPGAALAFIKTAKPENKTKTISIMISAAFASFFTGVTEPLEFAFMFTAPLLYFIHALLTGISLFIAATFQWVAGFAFSAGMVDLVLSFNLKLANKPYMLIVQGLFFFGIYYFIFSAIIKAMNLKTPGREDEVSESEEFSMNKKLNSNLSRAQVILGALGGKENITELDNCATRIRVSVNDLTKVEESLLKKNSSGIIKLGKNSIQIVIGPKVEFLSDEIKYLLK